ncbi:glycosyltransferase [bacterium]|nr:glycosyltransferase [bacterium]
MKIAFIVGHFPSMSETFILNQITGLIDLGHEVDIFAFEKKEYNCKVHEEIITYNLLDKVHYFYSPKKRSERLTGALFIIIRNFHKNPFAIKRCLNFKKYGRYHAINNLFKCRPFFEKKYDIIHCHFGSNALKILFLKEVFDIKLVTSFHGYDLSLFINEHGKNVYRPLFEKGDLFLPVSEYWKRCLLDLGCSIDKIIVHHAGILVEDVALKKNKPNSYNKIKIITVARLVEKKGIEFAILASKNLMNNYANMEYIIVGDGPLRERIELMLNSLSMNEHIKLLGWRTKKEVRESMDSADIFVLPCVTSADGDMEGIPVSLMEAQGFGLPVVSTYHSGIPELVKDGETGFLVAERDIDSLTSKLEYLIRDREICLKMGKHGQKLVAEKFNIRKLNKRLVDIYKHCIDKRKG